MKSPEEKIKKYEHLLHLLQLNRVAMNSQNVRKLLDNIDNWSYAHRVGNGMLSDEEQQERIDAAFDLLTNLD